MAGKSRLKAVAQPAPQSREEADQLLGQIGALQREIARIEAELTDQVERAKAAAKERAAPLAATVQGKFQALSSWAEANKATLLEGDRRSVRLAHGAIGWRWSPPAVKVARKAEAAVLATIRRLGLGLIRTREEIDKEAILRDPAAVEGIADIAVVQEETFWARPDETEVEQAATVQRLTGGAAVLPADRADEVAA